MRSFTPILAVLAAALCLATRARAQTPVDPAHPFSWQENCGWMNWASSPVTPGSGVRASNSFLWGYIWGENTGWVNVGRTPANAQHYANTDSADYGVNVNPADGTLSGYAWSENAGWINFSGGALAAPPNPARIDSVSRRFRGFAWGENIGWVNLDDTNAYVGLGCLADFDGNGTITVSDIFRFLSAWFLLDTRADVNGNGVLDVQDIFAYLTAWFAGC